MLLTLDTFICEDFWALRKLKKNYKGKIGRQSTFFSAIQEFCCWVGVWVREQSHLYGNHSSSKIVIHYRLFRVATQSWLYSGFFHLINFNRVAPMSVICTPTIRFFPGPYISGLLILGAIIVNQFVHLIIMLSFVFPFSLCLFSVLSNSSPMLAELLFLRLQLHFFWADYWI